MKSDRHFRKEVFNLKKDDIFAVVDIETTGTDPEKNRIIQFGCVLIEKGKIVSRFATDINPLQSIPVHIEQLTGISNKQVAHAPYFEDVAYTIYQLLDGCVFVAHNIHFDLLFLNSELKRCGVNELAVEGIDTVELAQIFLPQSAGFRVADLARQLDIIHDNPHQADSDAEVTAEIFLSIEQRIRQLPLVTMEQLVSLADVLAMDTQAYLAMIFADMRTALQPLDSRLKVINGIALRKKEIPRFKPSPHDTLPEEVFVSRALADEEVTTRQAQKEMVQLIQQFLQPDNSSENLLIEAATGIGKTLGYLLPLSYQATPETPVVISTLSIVLENQLINKELPLLNRLVGAEHQAVLLKSDSRYLDLETFAYTLRHPVKQKQYGLSQMATLVWLTETTTGDLNELKANRQQFAFWQQVSHQGRALLSEQSPFYADDFLVHREQQLAEASFIIVNHAYLCEENRRNQYKVPKSAVLVIDEAQHLPRILEKTSTQRFAFSRLERQLSRLTEETLKDSVTAVSAKNQTLSQTLALFYQVLDELSLLQAELHMFLTQFFGNSQDEKVFTKDQFDSFQISEKKLIRHVGVLLNEADGLVEKMMQYLISHLSDWLPSEKNHLLNLFALASVFKEWAETCRTFFYDWEPGVIKWTYLFQQQLTCYVSRLPEAKLPATNWYNRYDKIIFTGGTLQLNQQSHYFEHELGLEAVEKRKITDPYDYEKAARLFVLQKDRHIDLNDQKSFGKYVTNVVKKLVDVYDRPILVLFTSHDLLKRVYAGLAPIYGTKGREVLGQGISGSKERILKRFQSSSNAVLLGSESFWEGIDLPGGQLELIVMTRLPFDPPKRAFVKEKYAYLSSQGLNPFYYEALPQAASRLRQALGRLIRSADDKGVMVMLDDRLLTAGYSKRMLAFLPDKLPVAAVDQEALFQQISEFLGK